MASISGSGSSTFGAQAPLGKRAAGFCPASVQLPYLVEDYVCRRRQPSNITCLAVSVGNPNAHRGRKEAIFLPREPSLRSGIYRRRTRAAVSVKPVRCSSASSSSASSSPPQEVAARAAKTATPRRPFSPPSTSDLANFKPPSPALPITPEDLVADLPFQYWYSYADLRPGIPKRRPKKHQAPASESVESRDRVNKGRVGGNGALWEAVLAVASESELEPRKVAKRERRGPWEGEAEKGLLSRNDENTLNGATADALHEDGKTPLTEKERRKLIQSCHGRSSQINIGWEGWSPNYVPLVHSYWKRSQLCKIKCKGGVTLDMNSMCKLLEVETGGTVISRVGGTVYLFRGSNYDYWRDARVPVIRNCRIPLQFPKRLQVPSNLTEDIKVLRARGRDLPALCKLGKHGVYLTLLEDIRKAFETQDLVRVNCQGFYARNLKLLGSKLKALVPCELISFEFEHILMWRSKDENSDMSSIEQV